MNYELAKTMSTESFTKVKEMSKTKIKNDENIQNSNKNNTVKSITQQSEANEVKIKNDEIRGAAAMKVLEAPGRETKTKEKAAKMNANEIMIETRDIKAKSVIEKRHQLLFPDAIDTVDIVVYLIIDILDIR